MPRSSLEGHEKHPGTRRGSSGEELILKVDRQQSWKGNLLFSTYPTVLLRFYLIIVKKMNYSQK
jgi:hypothetical protein